ncbi:hypothetical protein TNCV_3619561 [Trichonephila clavipes]|nr:hypothetical protein TNCV_3619561 [Trichonephila clavipes]
MRPWLMPQGNISRENASSISDSRFPVWSHVVSKCRFMCESEAQPLLQSEHLCVATPENDYTNDIIVEMHLEMFYRRPHKDAMRCRLHSCHSP